jgi:hypothetical protein
MPSRKSSPLRLSESVLSESSQDSDGSESNQDSDKSESFQPVSAATLPAAAQSSPTLPLPGEPSSLTPVLGQLCAGSESPAKKAKSAVQSQGLAPKSVQFGEMQANKKG